MRTLFIKSVIISTIIFISLTTVGVIAWFMLSTFLYSKLPDRPAGFGGLGKYFEIFGSGYLIIVLFLFLLGGWINFKMAGLLNKNLRFLSLALYILICASVLAVLIFKIKSS